jgi:hypothetical protein
MKRPEQGTERNQSREWKRPTLKTVGTVGEVLRGGGGKVSTTTGDPGQPYLKPPGQG